MRKREHDPTLSTSHPGLGSGSRRVVVIAVAIAAVGLSACGSSSTHSSSGSSASPSDSGQAPIATTPQAAWPLFVKAFKARDPKAACAVSAIDVVIHLGRLLNTGSNPDYSQCESLWTQAFADTAFTSCMDQIVNAKVVTQNGTSGVTLPDGSFGEVGGDPFATATGPAGKTIKGRFEVLIPSACGLS
ncbi:MAG: hypothetical protein QOI75_7007 [Pseudonocardiales bacterium]|jgi:hypothetical protein|nr:hypothetical protein [Pseudonocardiales bacterium]